MDLLWSKVWPEHDPTALELIAARSKTPLTRNLETPDLAQKNCESFHRNPVTLSTLLPFTDSTVSACGKGLAKGLAKMAVKEISIQSWRMEAMCSNVSRFILFYLFAVSPRLDSF
jgi:predicted GNAT family acetyltransferase